METQEIRKWNDWNKNSRKNKSRKRKLRYDYLLPINDDNTVLMIDSWEDQEAIDNHHSSEMMNTIIQLREKYNLSMKAERYISDEAGIPEQDKKYY